MARTGTPMGATAAASPRAQRRRGRGASARASNRRRAPRRAVLAVRDEAETLAAPRLAADAPLEEAGAAMLGAVRRERHELADVARAAAVAAHALDLGEQPRDGILAAEARGVDTRAAAEAGDLDPGVL